MNVHLQVQQLKKWFNSNLTKKEVDIMIGAANDVKVNMREFLDTIQVKGKEKSGKRQARIEQFCMKYNLTIDDYDVLREKIGRNQYQVV